LRLKVVLNFWAEVFQAPLKVLKISCKFLFKSRRLIKKSLREELYEYYADEIYGQKKCMHINTNIFYISKQIFIALVAIFHKSLCFCRQQWTKTRHWKVKTFVV